MFSVLVNAKTYYISTGGTLINKGTKESPLPFSYTNEKKNHAGDLFLVRDGVYKGHNITNIFGEPGNPVIIKSENWLGAKLEGEKNKLDNSRRILWIKGKYSEFSGFEIYDVEQDRDTSDGSDFELSSGISLHGEYSKAYNNVIHDTAEGVESWSPAIGSELSWNIIYNIGWRNTTGGHGHIAYVQNKKDVDIKKTLAYNIGFASAGEGVHVYTEKGNISNINVMYNSMFRTGTLTGDDDGRAGRSYIMGGKQLTNRLDIIGNHYENQLSNMD